MSKDNSQDFTYIKGNQVLINEKLVKATLQISNGKITKIFQGDHDLSHVQSPSKIIDAGNNVLMPALVDTHTHINEPGREHWEGFWTATRAAAAGGFSTLIDMPLQSNPPTTTVDNFNLKLKVARNKCHVDVGFWGGALPDNRASLKPLVEMGIWGFKCFLIDTSFPEFPFLREPDVDSTMAELEGTGVVLLFHAEVDCLESKESSLSAIALDKRTSYQTLLDHRPPKMEYEAIQLIQRMCNKHKNVRAHIVHLSAAEAIPLVKEIKESGIPLTVETCPHYLHFSQDDVQDGETQYKCLPPIRSRENREKLWTALADGWIDMIVADHANCTPDCKTNDFIDSWGGVCGLQFGLSTVWTNAKKRGHTVIDVWRWMSYNTAQLAGLWNEKGQIKEGFNADLVIWDPEGVNEINYDMAEHKNKLSPYNGEKLFGKVIKTILKGQIIFDQGQLCEPQGQFLFRDLKNPGFSNSKSAKD